MLGEADFRVVHVSIQRTHLHLLVEANDKDALARGMHRFTIAAARALNEAAHRQGTVFPQHREDGGRAALDWCASGVGFDGWKEGGYVAPTGYEALPVRKAETWLMTVGWRRWGLIGAREVPG